MNCLLREHVLVSRHHLEPSAEVGKAGAEMHFIFEFFKDLVMMEVGVCKKTIEATNNIVEVFFGVGWYRDPVKVVRVDDSCRIVQGVDHVVDSAAI